MISLKPVKGLGSPAAIEHDGKCKRVLIDPRIWPKIPRKQQRFIIEHELAHCRHNVFDETEADRIGFKNFVRKGGNPRDASLAISKNLSLDDPQNLQRHKAMQRRVDQHNSNYPVSGFGPWDQAFDIYDQEQTRQAANNSGWNPADWNLLIDNISDSVADVIIGQGGRVPVGGQYPGYPNYQQPQNEPPYMFIIIGIIVVIALFMMLKK